VGWLSAFALVACVGDDTKPPVDSGTDGTVDATTDAQADAPSDAPQDGDAAVTNGKHAYVASFGGALYVYDTPLSATSTATVILKANFNTPSDVELVPGGLQLIVVDGGAQKLSIFNLPITSSSVAVTTISLDFAAVDGAFDSAGNFWVGGTGTKLEKFSPPFSNTSTPVTFTLPTPNAFGIAIGQNDNMFVGTAGHVYGFGVPDASVINPPVDNTHTATPTGIALNNGFFVSNFGSGVVDLYTGTFNNATTPTAVGGALLSQPTRGKFGNNGSLYVADATKGIVVLAPPQFTSGFTVPPNPDAGVSNMRGFTFGP
jgi:hypothetical protein